MSGDDKGGAATVVALVARGVHPGLISLRHKHEGPVQHQRRGQRRNHLVDDREEARGPVRSDGVDQELTIQTVAGELVGHDFLKRSGGCVRMGSRGVKVGHEARRRNGMGRLLRLPGPGLGESHIFGWDENGGVCLSAGLVGVC